MKKVLIVSFFLLLCKLSFCQKKLDFGQTDSIIKSRCQSITMGENYYVFTYPFGGGITTFAPPIIRECNIIFKNGLLKNESILFVFSGNHRIRKSLINAYFQKVFYFDEKKLSKIQWVIDDTLYNFLNSKQGYLSKLLYVYKHDLVYRSTCKLHSINNSKLPHSIIKLYELPKTELKVSDDDLLMATDKIYPYKKNKLLLLSNIKDKLMVLNVNSGEIEKSISSSLFNPEDVYCNYIVQGDTEKCNYNIKSGFIEKIREKHRQLLDFYYPKYDNTNRIFLYTFLEAFEKNDKDYKFKDEEGKNRVINYGKPILSTYDIFYELDTNLNVIQTYKLEEGIKNDNVYVKFDQGFKVKSNYLCSINGYNKISKSKKPLFSYYYKTNDKIVSLKDSPNINMNFSLQNIEAKVGLRPFFFTLDSIDYYSLNLTGKFYKSSTGEAVASLSGDGRPLIKKEIYKDFDEDTVSTSTLNFDIIALSNVFNNNFVCIIYYYQGSLMFELKDKNFKTIEISNLIKEYPSFAKTKDISVVKDYICIHDDKIFFISEENDKYWLNSFKIGLY